MLRSAEPSPEARAILLAQRRHGVDVKWDKAAHKAAVAAHTPWPLMFIAALAPTVSFAVLLRKSSGAELGEILLLTLPVCLVIYLVDLISGMLHITLDNPANLTKPAVKGLCLGFQQHHANPTLIYKMDLSDHLRPMATPLSGLYAVGVLVHGYDSTGICVLSLLLALLLPWMQLSHRWAHQPASQRSHLISALQRAGLALAPAQHLAHHEAPYLHTFCILTGHANPLLNRIIQIPGCSPHSRIWLPATFCSMVAIVVSLPLAMHVSSDHV
jgi:hypothetical protein